MSSLSPIDQFYQVLLAKKILVDNPNFFHRQYLRKVWFRRILETLFTAGLINSSQSFLYSAYQEPALSPAAGIALSALFLRGRSVLPGIFLGILISYLINQLAWGSAFIQSIAFTLYIFLIRETCLRLLGAVLPLPNILIFLKFIMISAFYSGIYAYLFHLSWIAELNGILYLTPLCLLFDPYSLETLLNKQAKFVWLGLLALILLQLLLLYFMPAPLSLLAGSIMMLAVLTYAFYFSPVACGIALLCLSAIYLSLNQTEPYIYALQALLGLSLALLGFSSTSKSTDL